MNPFGVGVVGIGDISDVYLANLARFGDIVRVVGCAGRDVEKARRKAAQHNLPSAYAMRDANGDSPRGWADGICETGPSLSSAST